MPDTPLNPAVVWNLRALADEGTRELRHVVLEPDLLHKLLDVAEAVAQPEVNSVEELDKLQVESVVMDKHGYVYLLVDEDDEFKWSRNGLDAKFPSWGIVFPARVLYRPEVKP